MKELRFPPRAEVLSRRAAYFWVGIALLLFWGGLILVARGCLC